MMKCLRFLDMISPQASLFIESEKRYKTVFGGVLSIIISILSVLCFIGFGMDLLKKENPNLYEYRVFNSTSEIEFENFPFVINIMRAGGFRINDLKRKVRIFMRFAIINSSDTKEPTKYKFFDLTSCSSVEFFKKNIHSIKSSIFGNEEDSYCLPNDFKEKIVGQFGNPYFRLSLILYGLLQQFDYEQHLPA